MQESMMASDIPHIHVWAAMTQAAMDTAVSTDMKEHIKTQRDAANSPDMHCKTFCIEGSPPRTRRSSSRATLQAMSVILKLVVDAIFPGMAKQGGEESSAWHQKEDWNESLRLC